MSVTCDVCGSWNDPCECERRRSFEVITNSQLKRDQSLAAGVHSLPKRDPSERGEPAWAPLEPPAQGYARRAPGETWMATGKCEHGDHDPTSVRGRLHDPKVHKHRFVDKSAPGSEGARNRHEIAQKAARARWAKRDR